MMTIPPSARRLIETLLHGLAITLGILRENYTSLEPHEQDEIHDAADAISAAAVECIHLARRRKRNRHKSHKTITPKTETAHEKA